MILVVDASAIAAIVWGEPDGEEIAAHIDGETLIAPFLLDFELINVAWKKVRRHPEKLEAGLVSLTAASRIPIRRVPTPMTDVLALAVRTGLSAYDASYLWLARSRDLELVTLDRTLARFVAEE
jgi:predicted nucleic acid-binding protein